MTKASPFSISIIIPVLNEEAYIEQALSSIGDDAGVECIVVDGGSDDQTCEIVRQWPNVRLIAAGTSSRATQMNMGADHAQGHVLLFLHADCQLPANAVERVRNACAERNVVGGSFCLGFTRRHWVFQFYSWCSQINHPLMTYGDQAQFVCKDVFDRINGFQEWPLMEDLEIQYRLRRQGKLVKIQAPVISSDRRYRRMGPVRHQVFNIVLVALFLMGVSPKRLAKWYKPTVPTG
ncbi:MAG: TIGR04283 family arsenosugar biosynthesis glycosyltransferase [Robiginitomaculum sp.]|nr:TIGR04283 family arsenosugar biosynthesis glycosyltransferase [Robiginitomaculum sp.]